VDGGKGPEDEPARIRPLAGSTADAGGAVGVRIPGTVPEGIAIG
jgi:hypothetical protein